MQTKTLIQPSDGLLICYLFDCSHFHIHRIVWIPFCTFCCFAFSCEVRLSKERPKLKSVCNTGVVTQCVCSAEKSDPREEPLDQSRKRRARCHRHITDTRFSTENGGMNDHSFCSQCALLHGGGRGEADGGGRRAGGGAIDPTVSMTSPSCVYRPFLLRHPLSTSRRSSAVRPR